MTTNILCGDVNRDGHSVLEALFLVGLGGSARQSQILLIKPLRRLRAYNGLETRRIASLG
jgi:hypothetical protein